MTCTHPRIITYHDADTGLPVQLWACAECGHRFEPLRLDDEALLRQALEALEKSGARMAFCEDTMHEIYPALEKWSDELGMSYRVVEVLGIGCKDIKPTITAIRARLEGKA